MIEQERKLREALRLKPQSGKLMSQLSICLHDQEIANKRMTTTSSQEESTTRFRMEAIELSRRAIRSCPNRPAGHLSLSHVSDNYLERMKSLRNAVNLWTQECPLPRTTLIQALIRLLVEPRHEQKRRQTSDCKDTRQFLNKKLDDTEQKLYEMIQHEIHHETTNSDILHSKESHLFLGRIEYRLGLFFRKLEPSDVYAPHSIKHFQRAIEILPNDHELVQTAQFWIATLSDDILIPKCPQEYIVGLYSTFSERFDKLLVEKLHYETPTKLRELVNSIRYNDKYVQFSKGADLGCGTGLSGKAFRNCVQTLIGVDLSPEMIEKARAKRCYEDLILGDILSILTVPNTYDIIFACDVFVYFGDLREVFESIWAALNSQGIFAFSTEFLDEGHPQSFCLQKCARFAHKQSYLMSLADSAGLHVLSIVKVSIRKNAGIDVQGILVVAMKS
jgi:predicted TPR repeat methyltransferase